MDDKDEEFERKLENNLDEIREGDAAGVKIQEEMAKQPPVNEQTWQDLMKQEQGERATITEAEARRMIDEEREKTAKVLKQTNAKNKRTLVVVLVVAVILCVLGVVFALVMGNRKGEQTGGSGENVPGQEVEPEEKPGEGTGAEGAEVEELALDDELVQRVYHDFMEGEGVFAEDWRNVLGEGLWVGEDKPTSDEALAVFLYNDRYADLAQACRKMPDRNENSEYVWKFFDGEELVLMDSELETFNRCFYGEVLRSEIKKHFDQDLTVDEMPISLGWWHYNRESDEYFYLCRGTGERFMRWGNDVVLYKADGDGKTLRLYTAAARVVPYCLWSFSDGCESDSLYIMPVAYANLTIGDKNVDVSPYLVNSIQLGGEVDFSNRHMNADYLNYITSHRNDLGNFKWTFTKNADGEYVFSRLERIEK